MLLLTGRKGRWLRWFVLALLGSVALPWACFLFDSRITVPVEGVPSTRLVSTFGAPRDGGRRSHEGTDIFARRGTPVRSAGWGVVVYRGTLRLGGKVVFVLGQGGILCYYAHLDGWADGLQVGDLVRRGTLVGRVGNTGNAAMTRPHLHFETRPAAFGFSAIDPVTALR